MMVSYIQEDSPLLAPLAGYSDLAFRLLCRQYGAKLAFTEMVSAKGLLYNSSGTKELLATQQEDSPLVVQLFGNEPLELASSIHLLQQEGFTAFDLNVGCSVPKVVKTGCGAALLKEPHKLYTIAKAMVEQAGSGNVGIKIRMGWNKEGENYLDVGQLLQDAGVAWVTFHPRYAKQGYSGVADWDAIARLVEVLEIPVVASGDLFSADDAYRCIQHTKASSVLFARGALQRPTIFQEYIARIKNNHYQPSPIREVVLSHIALLRKYVPEHRVLVRLRSILPRYYKGYSNKHLLHEGVLQAQSFDDIYKIIDAMEDSIVQ